MAKYGKRRRWDTPFVAIPSFWFYGHCEGYNGLSLSAKMVYFCLKSGYVPHSKSNPGNNGHITFSYSQLKRGTGISSFTTIGKALRELESNGWIRITRGGLKDLNRYELTGKYDTHL